MSLFSPHTLLWVLFGVLVVAALAVDLAFFNRRAHEVRMREALMMSGFWIGLAVVFNIVLYFWQGPTTALEFLTAYLVEESLSVDNLFVFLMLFSYFSVPRESRHKVLFWGIAGVVVMRGIFIFAGIALIERLHWIIYVFGVALVLTAAKLAFGGEREVHPERNPVVRIFRRIMPVTKEYHGSSFFVREDGKLKATPLLIVLLVVETTDVMFAVDSIPAVFAITLDRLVVYTSNIFAVLGLRALFFALAGFMELFHYLNYGLAAILAFVGVKMLLSGYYRMPIGVALGTIAGILVLSVVASLLFPKKEAGGAAPGGSRP